MATRKTALALLLALAACGRSSKQTDEAPGPRIERADDPVPYQYLVVLKPDAGAAADVAATLVVSEDAWVLRSYERALHGFAMHASEATALAVAKDPRVALVAEDGRVRAQSITWQQNAPAGLDRIDQRSGTNHYYGYNNLAGDRVNAYVLDTGVLASHLEFLGRPPDQVDFVRDGAVSDCNGHGTYVAAIVGGKTYGVAKKVKLHSLRVLGCDASGTTSDVVAALDWLVGKAQRPAVANLSFGRGGDAALDAAVEAVVAAGIPVVVAAGDARRDACSTSPARTPSALTVASTELSGTTAAAFSNRGPCVDMFAPGVDILSASIEKTPDSALTGESYTYGESVVQSGTSASAPFVTGAVALYLGRYTGATPDAVARALFGNSTRAPATLPRYTPDRFLYTPFVDDDNSADAEAPTVTVDAPTSGATVSGSEVAVTVTASDDVAVTRVELFANGRFIASRSAPPYAFTWDSRRETNGNATLVARAYDRAGNATDGTAVTVTVSNDGIAHFDAALGIPRCETFAPACDSVDLLTGRGDGMGPEENAPNTLAYSCPTASDPAAVCVCPDGPFGAYQLDESIEEITVRTLGGGNLAAGADVEVAVQAYIASTYQDELDLYSSPTVSPPSWRHLGSLKAVASGLQTLTARFTLPEGGVQAVQAALRNSGVAAACTDGGFDERDDLAFSVAAGAADTTDPANVAITSPRENDRVSGTITVTANATDDHLVSRVEFTVGSILVGTDFEAATDASAPPFSVSWNSGNVPNGDYELRATAFDGAGNVTVSDPVHVRVDDQTSPTVSITSPTTGTQVTATPITVRAAAQDNGIVKQVELWQCSLPCADFSRDGRRYAIDTSYPYEFAWSGARGDYELVARAVDGAPLTADSAPVVVTVGDTNPPTCSIKPPIDPVDPTHVIDPTNMVGAVLLEAEAVDDTEVASVSFYQEAVPEDVEIGRTAAPPYTTVWYSGPLPNSTYNLYCVATDTSGLTTPDPRRLTLTVNDATAPSVAIVSPPVTHDSAGTVVATPVSDVILVKATASDDGAVRIVEFYLGDPPVLLGSDDAAPYELSWNSGSVVNGAHTLTAKAYDYNGHSTVSDPVQIGTNDSTAPSVTMLFPLAGATITDSVTVRAQVSDPGGVIATVELLDGNLVVATSTAAAAGQPYVLTWDTTSATAGSHTLTVNATDVAGNVGSASVQVILETTGAVYDSAVGAPVCASEGSRCQSSLLLDGRGALGPEVNAPNNLKFPCPTASNPAAVCQCIDGDMGEYHVDESIDFISVSSHDGGTLTGGGLVDVEVRAWIFDPAQDRVDLFYAADATNPVWFALTNVPVAGNGLQTLTTSYTLPHGSRQVFRASVRYGAASGAGPCVQDDFNDHDDLVFAVAPAPDSTPPQVAITGPVDGQSVGGLVTITADATDDIAVSSVSFLVDGVVIGTDYTAPYGWTWDASGLSPGARTITASATDLAGNVTVTAPVNVTVADLAFPTVVLTAPMPSESVMGTVLLAADAGDNVGVDKVEFLVDGVPVATDSTLPYSASWYTAVPDLDGTHTVTAKAYDAAGNVTESPPIAILVSNFGNASFDRQLAVPGCSSAGTKCFTGTLVNGRGPLGPEADAPNTLRAACGDGIQGTYHVDESIDAVTVRSNGTLTAGGTAIVEVQVWAGQAYLMDSLDLFYTADAVPDPTAWTYITTLVPDRPGPQVLSGTYTLPAGARQAVRAQLRFGGGLVDHVPTIVCGDGTFDDRDDLVFVVNP